MIILEHTTGALFSIGPLEVTGTVTTTWAIILVLTVLSILATRNLKDVPGPLQNAAEMALDSLQNYFAGNLGWEKMRRYFPMFAYRVPFGHGGAGDNRLLHDPHYRHP